MESRRVRGTYDESSVPQQNPDAGSSVVWVSGFGPNVGLNTEIIQLISKS